MVRLLFLLLCLTFLASTDIERKIARDGQTKINQILQEVQCNTGSQKRMFIGLKQNVDKKHLIEMGPETTFGVNKNFQFTGSKKLYVAKSESGDIFVIQKRGWQQHVYAYLCERDGFNLQEYSYASFFIEDMSHYRECNIREFRGVISMDFEQIKNSLDLEPHHVSLALVPLHKRNGAKIPQSLCDEEVVEQDEINSSEARKWNFEEYVEDYLVLSGKKEVEVQQE